MYLASPKFLLLLFSIPFVFLFFLYTYRKDKLVFKLLHKTNKSKWSYIFLSAVWLILLASMAVFLSRLQLETKATLKTTPRGDYLIAFDVSRSMAAKHSLNENTNLDKAKSLVRKTVNSAGTARWQIFIFSRFALPISYLTEDVTHLQNTLKRSVTLGSMQDKGSDIPNTLEVLASHKLSSKQYKNVKYILLISDGQISTKDRAKLQESIQSLQRAKLRVVALGVGSKDGQRIPIYDSKSKFTGRYETTNQGQVFISYLQDGNLRRIATATNGKYFSQDDIEGLIRYINSTLSDDYKKLAGSDAVVKEDKSWIFLVVFFGAFLVLLWKVPRWYW